MATEAGLPVLLAHQDRERWDRALIREGLLQLESARAAGGQGRDTLEAEIAAQHITAGSWEATDWPRIVALYDTLLAREPGAVRADGGRRTELTRRNMRRKRRLLHVDSVEGWGGLVGRGRAFVRLVRAPAQ